MKSRKFKFLLFVFYVILIMASACKKKVEVSSDLADSEQFIKGFGEPGNQTGVFVKETDDNGLLLFSQEDRFVSGDNLILTITKTDARGKVQWKKKIAEDTLNCYFSETADGGVLACSKEISGCLIKFDRNGNLLFRTRTLKISNYNFSPPIQVAGGAYKDHFLMGFSSGGSGGTNSNYIMHFMPDGSKDTSLTLTQLNDNLFGPKVLWTSVYRYEDPQIYYITGTLFNLPNWNWNSQQSLYFSKIKIQDSVPVMVETKIMQLAGESEWRVNDIDVNYVVNPDNSLVLGVTTYSPIQRKFKVHIFKVDENQNKVWELDLNINKNSETFKSVSRTHDGNYLVCGNHSVDGKSTSEPFLSKISGDGKVLWIRFFPSTMHGEGIFARELNSGKLILTGDMNSFGGGIQQKDVYLIKTNAEGIVE